MRRLRRSAPVALLVTAGLLAACGSSSTSTTTTGAGPTGSTTTVPTGSSSSVASTSTPTTGAGPRNVAATVATKAALQSAFVAYTKVPAGDIAGTQAGTVYYAYDPTTRTYWALATFTPSATASQDTLVGMQDGGSTGVFRQPAGGGWTMLTTGSFPFCPSRTPLPAAVRTVWGLSDPAACTTQG
jgi:hypothetical protein